MYLQLYEDSTYFHTRSIFTTNLFVVKMLSNSFVLTNMNCDDGGESLIVSYGCFGSPCSLITTDALGFV